jgi:hypothetical protein
LGEIVPVGFCPVLVEGEFRFKDRHHVLHVETPLPRFDLHVPGPDVTQPLIERLAVVPRPERITKALAVIAQIHLARPAHSALLIGRAVRTRASLNSTQWHRLYY